MRVDQALGKTLVDFGSSRFGQELKLIEVLLHHFFILLAIYQANQNNPLLLDGGIV